MKPFQAFPGQDHRAHITAHLNFMSTNMVRNNPMVMAAIQKNILEHISLMANEQVQLEFREQLQQMQMMQQQAASNPQVAAQLQALSQEVEARKSVLIALILLLQGHFEPYHCLFYVHFPLHVGQLL